MSYAVALIGGVLAQVEHLRRALAMDGTEFGIQFGAETSHEATFQSGRHAAPLQNVDFPILPIGPMTNFDDVLNLIIRDLANHFGAAKAPLIETEWQTLLG